MADVEDGRIPPPPPPGDPPTAVVASEDPNRTLTRGASQARRRPSAAVSTTGSYSRRDGDDLTVAVWALGGPLTLTLMSSIIQAAASINVCTNPIMIAAKGSAGCQGLFGFSVALGVVSALLVAGYLLAFVFFKVKLPDKSMLYLSLFLFVWWAAGVGATTFLSTTVPDTAYFTTWSSFIFSGMVLHSEWEQFATAMNNFKALQLHGRATFYVLIAGIIELIASIFFCADITCTGNEIYAMVVGFISIIVCLVFLRVDAEKLGGADKFLAIFLVLWWTVGMGVLTISGPFLFGGNGFFACWAGFLLSFFVAQAKIFPHSDAALEYA